MASREGDHDQEDGRENKGIAARAVGEATRGQISGEGPRRKNKRHLPSADEEALRDAGFIDIEEILSGRWKRTITVAWTWRQRRMW